MNGSDERIRHRSGIHPIRAAKRRKKSKDSWRDLGDNIRQTDIHITGVPKGEESKKGTGKSI